MVHSPIGLVHLTAALLAMISGAIVLLNTKGGLLHKRAGYVYVAAMLTVNGTAFMLYHLFGKFGVFHWLALVSLTAILGGMVPALLRKTPTFRESWIYWHYYFMNWSVVGLYAAFWAETFTRLSLGRQFWPLVFGATLATAFIGSRLIRKHAARLLPKPIANQQTVAPADMLDAR